MRSPRLTLGALACASRALARRDAALARVVSRHGTPPMWGRRAGFATLVQIILEQQVSLASGRAAYGRLERVAAGPVTPERIAGLRAHRLRSAGLTRQKATYISLLARATVAGSFDAARIARMPDDQARAALVSLKGIGPWSADVYLLMALRRADVWPSGDLALQIAAQELLGLSALPSARDMDILGERWRPFRAVAARLLWHHYLSTPRYRVVRDRHTSNERLRPAGPNTTRAAKRGPA